ncbi:hypothetical protein SEUCBS139899_000482 [Sporothrix eucalyptigena]
MAAAIDSSRFASLVKTRRAIADYGFKVAADEQPYKRVADLVQFALNRRTNFPTDEAATPGHFVFDESVIQTGSSLHAALLLMRCDILALERVSSIFEKISAQDKVMAEIGGLHSRKNQSLSSPTNGIYALKKIWKTERFADLLKDFEAWIAVAHSGKHTKQEAEIRVCCVQLCIALSKLHERCEDKPTKIVEGRGGEGDGAAEEDVSGQQAISVGVKKSVNALSSTSLKEKAEQHINDARALVQEKPSLDKHIGSELERLKLALVDFAFYQPVSVAELQDVYKAMATEFSGSGHWYTCAHGHLFTVGECGMPMEQARCNECGAPVGGQHHINVEGVQRADAIEELGRGVNRLGIE